MKKEQIRLILFFIMLFFAGIIALTHYFFHTTNHSDKQLMAGEMQTIASQIVNYFNTPRRVQGGGGEIREEDAQQLSNYIRFTGTSNIKNSSIMIQTKTERLELQLSENTVTIIGISNSKKMQNQNPLILQVCFNNKQPEITFLKR